VLLRLKNAIRFQKLVILHVKPLDFVKILLQIHYLQLLKVLANFVLLISLLSVLQEQVEQIPYYKVLLVKLDVLKHVLNQNFAFWMEMRLIVLTALIKIKKDLDLKLTQ
jgi:hypothetical protein